MPVSATWVSAAANGALDLAVGATITEGWMDSVVSDLLVLGGTDGLTKTGNYNIAGYFSVIGGTVGIGLAPSPDRSLWINGSNSTSGSSQYGIVSSPTSSPAATVSFDGVYSQPITATATYTVAQVASFHAITPARGANSTITNAYGLLVEAINGGNVNNFGILVNAPNSGSGTNVGIRVQGGSPAILVDAGGIVMNGANVHSGNNVRVGSVQVASAPTGTDTIQAVTFSSAMSAVPIVMLTHRLNGSDPSRIYVAINTNGITTTGFGLQVRNDLGAPANVTVDYLAFLNT